MEYLTRHKNATLYFSKLGTGPKALLAFHGFGQSNDVFNNLSEALSNVYTLYNFDIFFHGKSEWHYDERPLEKDFWNEIIRQFLKDQEIESFGVIGYSMGGKFALATISGFPTRVKEVFLIAPDGVWVSPWYTLATGPTVMRKLFKSMILKPERFQFIARVAYKLGLIDKSMFRFTETQMNTEQKRKQVYDSWVLFRLLKFDMDTIATLLNSNNVSVMLIVGKYDQVFPVKKIKKLSRKLRACSVDVLDAGHNSLIRKSIPLIQSKVKADGNRNR